MGKSKAIKALVDDLEIGRSLLGTWKRKLYRPILMARPNDDVEKKAAVCAGKMDASEQKGKAALVDLRTISKKKRHGSAPPESEISPPDMKRDEFPSNQTI